MLAFFVSLLYVPVTAALLTEARLTAPERMIAAGILLVSAVWLFLAAWFLLTYPKKQARRRFADYEADVKRHHYGSRITLYADRVEITSVRGTRCLHFSEIEQCVETADGFALLRDTTCLILRSRDLMAYDLQLVRDCLAERLAPSVMHGKGRAQAGLLQPLPIPQFNGTVTPLTSAAVPLRATTLYRRERKARLRRLLLTAEPLAWIGGSLTSVFIAATDSFLLDLLIGIAGWSAGIMLVGIGAFFLFDRPCREELRVAFEPDGLRLKAADTERFIIKERVGLQMEESGVTLHFLHRESLFIPADAVENLFVLRTLVGIE